MKLASSAVRIDRDSYFRRSPIYSVNGTPTHYLRFLDVGGALLDAFVTFLEGWEPWCRRGEIACREFSRKSVINFWLTSYIPRH